MQTAHTRLREPERLSVRRYGDAARFLSRANRRQATNKLIKSRHDPPMGQPTDPPSRKVSIPTESTNAPTTGPPTKSRKMLTCLAIFGRGMSIRAAIRVRRTSIRPAIFARLATA